MSVRRKCSSCAVASKILLFCSDRTRSVSCASEGKERKKESFLKREEEERRIFFLQIRTRPEQILGKKEKVEKVLQLSFEVKLVFFTA